MYEVKKVNNGVHAYEINIMITYIGGRVGLSTTSSTSLREHR